MLVFKPLKNNDRFNFRFSKSTNGGGRWTSKKQPLKDFRLLKKTYFKAPRKPFIFRFPMISNPR